MEYFDLCLSNQEMLVNVVPSCFHFAKMRLCQVSLLLRRGLKYLTSSSWGSCALFVWTRGHISLLMVKMTLTDFDLLAFILHFLNLF
jgi:hypothetical protein